MEVFSVLLSRRSSLLLFLYSFGLLIFSFCELTLCKPLSLPTKNEGNCLLEIQVMFYIVIRLISCPLYLSSNSLETCCCRCWIGHKCPSQTRKSDG
jgi:hypothetical protein